MKTFIIKTVIITLIIIIALFAIVTGVLFAFFPSVIANAAFRFQDGATCIKYSEKQYVKTQEIRDLSTLTERAITFSDYNSVCKFAEILIFDEDFESFCTSRENGYKNYIEKAYVEALYKTDNKQKSVEVAFGFYDGVNNISAVSVLIYNAKDDSETLNLILLKLQSCGNTTATQNFITTVQALLVE